MTSMDGALTRTRSAIGAAGLSWPLLVFVISVLGVLAIAKPNTLLSDPDTYWHLATGGWIMEHGSVPQGDPFSHSMPNAEWTAHEWLSEIAMVSVQRAAGWSGLVALFTLCFAATLASVCRFFLGRMEPAHALLFTAITGSMAANHLMARPHVLGWLMLALWATTLIDASEQRRAPPWWLLALMALWANLHGSFTLGVLFGGALAVDAVISQAPGERRATARRWGVFVLLSVVVSMATPAGWRGLWYTIHVMNLSFGLEIIQEWASPNFHEFQMIEVWLLVALAAGFAGLLRLPGWRLLLVLGLVHIALKHQRYGAVLGLLAPLLMAAPLAAHWARLPKRGQDAEAVDRVFRALAQVARPAAVAGAGVAVALMLAAAQGASRFAPDPKATPAAALDAVLKLERPGKVLNAYNFGGYLIYRGVPVFMDGRAEMYGDDLLRPYAQALTLASPAALGTLLEKYDIGWTLLQPGTAAIVLLDGMPGWKRLYADDVAVVHVRSVVGVREPGVGSR